MLLGAPKATSISMGLLRCLKIVFLEIGGLQKLSDELQVGCQDVSRSIRGRFRKKFSWAAEHFKVMCRGFKGISIYGASQRLSGDLWVIS